MITFRNSRKFSCAVLFSLVISTTVHACPFHAFQQDRLTSQLAALTSNQILMARKKTVLQDKIRNEQMVMYLFLDRLNKVHEELVSFNYHQAVVKHYSKIDVAPKAKLATFDPATDDIPLLISEMDVLAELVEGKHNWKEIKSRGWVVITGSQDEQKKQLDQAFQRAFP